MVLILEIALGIVFGVILLNFLPIILPIIAVGGFLYIAFWVIMFAIVILMAIGKNIIAVLFIAGIVGFIAITIGSQKKIEEESKKKEKPKNNTHELSPPVLDNPSLYESRYRSKARRYDEPDEEVAELMENHDLDKEEAEHVRDIMDEEGLDEDDAVELKDEL